MSTWLSNATIGLDPEGYGALLGEVTFTCSRVGLRPSDSMGTIPLITLFP